MITREVFERGTSAFNAHDIDRFAEVLDDEVELKAPGVSGRGKQHARRSIAAGCSPFPMLMWTLRVLTSLVTPPSRMVRSRARTMVFSTARQSRYPQPAAQSGSTTCNSSAFATVNMSRSTWRSTGFSCSSDSD